VQLAADDPDETVMIEFLHRPQDLPHTLLQAELERLNVSLLPTELFLPSDFYFDRAPVSECVRAVWCSALQHSCCSLQSQKQLMRLVCADM
jgi:hypothetical protein